MWKWLVVLACLIVFLMPMPALADTSDTVTITATGYVCEAPGGFTLYYISDHELGISWVKGIGAENTMVRVKDSAVPTSRTDGNLVYYGDGINAIDTGVDFEESTATKYYRAWSQNADGLWEEVGASGFMENPAMIMWVCVFLAVALMVFAYISKKGVVAFASAGGWLVLCAVAYTKRGATFDVYWGLFMLAGVLAIVSALEPVFLHKTVESKEDDGLDDEDRALIKEREANERERSAYTSLYGRRRRKTQHKLSHYERTGEH